MLTRYELSPQELMLLNSEMRPREKSLGLAYLMLIGGHLGVHRFYLKRIGTGIAQLALFLLASFSYFLFIVTSGGFESSDFIGFAVFSLVLFLITAGTLFVWIVVDLFLIPRMIRGLNAQLEEEVLKQLEWLRYNPQTPHGGHQGQPAGAPHQPYPPQPPYPQR